MKYIVFSFLAISLLFQLPHKILPGIITKSDVERIENILASDSLEGRRVFTPGISKAADFISSEFKKANLSPLGNDKNYRQNFYMLKPKLLSLSCTINNMPADEKNVIVLTTQENLSVNEKSGYEKMFIQKNDIFFKK